jgi:hypothetical protein
MIVGFLSAEAVGMTMKAVRAILGLALFVLGAGASTAALAWHHGGHARVGVYIGAPAYWYAPYYYPPYYAPYYPGYYFPPAVVAPSPPPTYIERGDAQAAPAPAASAPQSQSAAQTPSQSNWWYYCADAKAYYPYVKECPAGWQQVAPQPPR